MFGVPGSGFPFSAVKGEGREATVSVFRFRFSAIKVNFKGGFGECFRVSVFGFPRSNSGARFGVVVGYSVFDSAVSGFGEGVEHGAESFALLDHFSCELIF